MLAMLGVLLCATAVYVGVELWTRRRPSPTDHDTVPPSGPSDPPGDDGRPPLT